MTTDSGGVEVTLRGLTHLLQVVLAGIVAYSVVTANVRLFINAVLPLAVALAPAVLRYQYGYRINPILGVWIAAAAVIHAVGVLGPYQQYPWYDQIAHGVSASLIAGVGYASIRAIETKHSDIRVPANLRFVFILVFGIGIGVLWEIGEFGLGLLSQVTGGEPLLKQFGLSDAVLDLAANVVGAALAALYGTRYFDDLRAVLRQRFVEAE